MIDVDGTMTVGTPLTRPPTVIVATVVVALLHAPPATVLLKGVDVPEHMVVVPLIDDGGVRTVTVTVRVQPVVII